MASVCYFPGLKIISHTFLRNKSDYLNRFASVKLSDFVALNADLSLTQQLPF